MLKIKHSVCVYIVNPDDPVYKRYAPKKALKTFLSKIKQPNVVQYIQVDNYSKISAYDLGTLNKDFNLVVLPSQAFYFDVSLVGKAIVLTVSLAAGNPKYSHGIYHQPLSLVSKYLGGKKVDIGRGSLYYRLKPEGKAIIIASMVDVTSAKVFETLYRRLRRIKLATRQKCAILNILKLKKYKYKLYSGV